MNPLYIQATDDTPEIHFDKTQGIFRITGKSLPEDVISFYTPAFSWLEQYISDPNEHTKVEVKVVYFNSASQRALNEIFTILSRVRIKNKEIVVDWYFIEDDEEMCEAGEEYADITKIEFNFKTYNPE